MTVIDRPLTHRRDWLGAALCAVVLHAALLGWAATSSGNGGGGRGGSGEGGFAVTLAAPVLTGAGPTLPTPSPAMPEPVAAAADEPPAADRAASREPSRAVARAPALSANAASPTLDRHVAQAPEAQPDVLAAPPALRGDAAPAMLPGGDGATASPVRPEAPSDGLHERRRRATAAPPTLPRIANAGSAPAADTKTDEQPTTRSPMPRTRPARAVAEAAATARVHSQSSQALAAAPRPASSAASGGGRSDEPGDAGPAGRGGPGAVALLGSYMRDVAAALARHQRYPDMARRRRIEGGGQLSLTIAADGRLLAASVAQSTGSALLDREIDAMARRAAPFPPLPPETGRTQLTLVTPVRFRLQ